MIKIEKKKDKYVFIGTLCPLAKAMNRKKTQKHNERIRATLSI